MQTPFSKASVAEAFDAYAQPTRQALLSLRELIFSVAEKTEGVGPVDETLKWGQPAYLTPETKSGTTIRIDASQSDDCDYALFVHCQSRLISDWRERYPQLVYGGTRSLHFNSSEPLPRAELEHCVALALTYHLRKNKPKLS